MPKHTGRGRAKALRNRTWLEATVALGGNQGDVAATFKCALQNLAAFHTQVLAVSSLYQSVPLRLPHGLRQDDASESMPAMYVNGACSVQTLLGPLELLRHLQRIEDALGRTRTSLWASRTLDLDLITHNHCIMRRRRLTLPHPGIAYRSFVLAPLRDINVHHPWPDSCLSVPQVMPERCDLTYGIVRKKLHWSAF